MFARLVLSIAFATLPLAAQDVNRFRITGADGAIQGTQQYRIEKTTDGYRVTSTTVLEKPQRAELKEEQTLTPEWGLDRYKLTESAGGEQTVIEAWHNNYATMRISIGDDSRTKSTVFHPHTQVIDKLMVSHLQVFLNRVAGKVEGNEEWLVLVPQELTAQVGKLTAAGEASGTLGGKKIALRKYTLQVGPQPIELWVQADTNQLMRAVISKPDIDLIRDSFGLSP